MAIASNNKERRHYGRIPVGIVIDDFCNISTFVKSENGILRDISRGGISLETLSPFPIGSKLVLNFNLNEKTSIKNILAEVVYLNKEKANYVCGCKFAKLGISNWIKVNFFLLKTLFS